MEHWSSATQGNDDRAADTSKNPSNKGNPRGRNTRCIFAHSFCRFGGVSDGITALCCYFSYVLHILPQQSLCGCIRSCTLHRAIHSLLGLQLILRIEPYIGLSAFVSVWDNYYAVLGRPKLCVVCWFIIHLCLFQGLSVPTIRKGRAVQKILCICSIYRSVPAASPLSKTGSAACIGILQYVSCCMIETSTFILKGTVLQWAEIIYDEEWQTKQTAESLLMTNIGDNGLPRRIAVH